MSSYEDDWLLGTTNEGSDAMAPPCAEALNVCL